MTIWSTIQKGFFSYQNRMLLPEVCRVVNAGPRTTGDRPQSAYAFTIGTAPTDDAMLPGEVVSPRGRNLMRQTFHELDLSMPLLVDPRYVVEGGTLYNWLYGVAGALRNGWLNKYDAARTWRAALLAMRTGADAFQNELVAAGLNLGATDSVAGTPDAGFMGCAGSWPGFSGCSEEWTVRYSPAESPDVTASFEAYLSAALPGFCCMGFAPGADPGETDDLYSGVWYFDSFTYAVRSELTGWYGAQGTTATFTVTADWAAFAAIWADVEGGEGGTPYITVEVTPNFQAAPMAIDGKYSLSLVVASGRALDVRQIGTSYVWEVDLPIDGSDHTITVTPTLAMIDDDGGFAGAWERGFESGEDYRGSYVIYVPELTIDQEVKFQAA